MLELHYTMSSLKPIMTTCNNFMGARSFIVGPDQHMIGADVIDTNIVILKSLSREQIFCIEVRSLLHFNYCQWKFLQRQSYSKKKYFNGFEMKFIIMSLIIEILNNIPWQIALYMKTYFAIIVDIVVNFYYDSSKILAD